MATAGIGESLAAHAAAEATTVRASGLGLEDGAQVAVIGGGPAGSLFSHFILRMAQTIGLDIGVDVFEPRHFTHRGPAGCNHCGGIVSESLVQILATEGINLPPTVVQRGIDSYTLHLDVGNVRIDTPVREKRIAAVYRGNGPRESELMAFVGFDGYLQQLAADAGARLIRKLVSEVQQDGESIAVTCTDGTRARYDLVAVAAGVNSRFLDGIPALGTGFRQPTTSKAFICEFRMGQATIEEVLGTSMHIFLLDLPRLEFAALIPKGDFVTLVLLGQGIDEDLVESFLNTPEVRRCFPRALVPPAVCHCFPRLNVRAAHRPYADRLVMVGDTGATRLYKDGIGAAYRTAKAAANTAVFHGVSAEDFRQHFYPACQRLEFDNGIGRLIFAVTHGIQKARFLRRAVLRMTANEQRRAGSSRRMSQVLWDVFTGSAPYREVLVRTFHPAFIGSLVWNVAVASLPFVKTLSRNGKARAA